MSVKPVLVVILSELLQPLKEGDENRYDRLINKLVDLYIRFYRFDCSYDKEQVKFQGLLRGVLKGERIPKAELEKYFGKTISKRNFLTKKFQYFQKKCVYRSGKDSLDYHDGLDFPGFGRLPMSVKRGMTLADVKKLSNSELETKVDSMALIHNLSLIIHRCIQLFESNYLLSSFTESELKSICLDLGLDDDGDNDVAQEIRVKMIYSSSMEADSDVENERMVLRERNGGRDVIAEEIEVFEEMAIENSLLEEGIANAENIDENITGEMNKRLVLNQDNLENLLKFEEDEMVQNAFGPLLGTGQLSQRTFAKLAKGLKHNVSATSIFEWIGRKWNSINTGMNYYACQCGYTAYVLEKENQINCQNPECTHKQGDKVKMRYESIRAFLAFLFLHEDLFNKIVTLREKNKNNKETLNSFGVGNTAKEHHKSDNDPNSFCFNLGMSLDGCNIHDKTMFNLNVAALTVLDLPPEYRRKKEFCYIPAFFQNIPNSPGTNKEMMKIMMTDLMDLKNEGFKVMKNGVENTLYANLISFTGDIHSLAASLELQDANALHPCGFCKIKKVSIKKGGLSLSFKNLNDNSMITLEELREMVKLKDFATKTDVWKLKADFTFTTFEGLDFMRICSPDLKHIALENIFPKSIFGALFLQNKFKIVDKKSHKAFEEELISIKNYLTKHNVWEGPRSIDAFFTFQAYMGKLKATDSKILMHAFPLICRKYLGKNNIHSKILGLITRMNHLLLCFMSLDVQRLHVPLLKKEYVEVMLEIEEIADNYPFLNVLFSLSTHMVVHMYDKWCDVGAFFDTWCFSMERTCKDVKALANPGIYTMATLGIRVPVLHCSNLMFISKMKIDNMSCYDYESGELCRNNTGKKTLLEMAAKKFEIKDTALIRVFEHQSITIRSIELRLNECKSYAKYRVADTWQFMKVHEIVRFNYQDENLLVICYSNAVISSSWMPCQTSGLEMCIESNIESVGTKNWMRLNNDVNIVPVYVLSEHGNLILDQRPNYNMLFRVSNVSTANVA